MVAYIIRHFTWDRHGFAFPPSPIPKDFQALCPSYELVMAEEAAEDYEIPKLPQVIFYTMLLNEAEGSCMGERFESWGQPLQSFVGTPLSCGCGCMMTVSSKPGSGRGRHQRKAQGPVNRERARRRSRRARTQPQRGRPPCLTMKSGVSILPEEVVQRDKREHRERSVHPFSLLLWHFLPFTMLGRWLIMRASRPPRPLPEDFHTICPRFSLPKAEGAAADFELPKMVQATFYAILLNEAVELGVVRGFMAEGLKSALVGLRWSSFEVWMSCVDHELREVQLRWQAILVEVRGPLDGRPSWGLLIIKGFQLVEATWQGWGGWLLPSGVTTPRTSVPCSIKGGVISIELPSFLCGRKREKRKKMDRGLFPNFASTEQAAEYVRDHFRWSLTNPIDPGPRPFSSDYHGLCSRFDLKVAR
ncbi:hypothetical protein Cgig2_012681 [Carnegiea gigantea]|uniref:Uncharacterized protein n=1 Tax=Carnegiea gigantea TaxID=171969 RepID=A0A9Q1JZI8_9CARY|nr:hypothetical protein Cgig2_012681 [Carnegiea gigantea]